MYIRLIILLVAGLLLAGTHWRAYKVGGNAVEAKYQAQTLTLERKLVQDRQKAEERYEEQRKKAASAAAGARTELDRLRHELALRGAHGSDTAPSARTDDQGAVERGLLGVCATELQELGAEADRLAGKVTGLQDYVKSVCLPQ